jgi:hypothetical protein
MELVVFRVIHLLLHEDPIHDVPSNITPGGHGVSGVRVISTLELIFTKDPIHDVPPNITPGGHGVSGLPCHPSSSSRRSDT